MSVNGSQIAVLVRPFVPDGHTVVAQECNVAVSPQEPEQLVDDGAQMQFLGSQQREAATQVEAHLIPEDAQRTGAGAVVSPYAMVAHMPHQL